MRTAIFAAAAALAAGALAVPMEKREVVTEIDRNVVYVTQYTTVTGGSQQTAAAAPVADAKSTTKKHYGHHVQWGNRPNWWGGSPNKGEKTTTTKTTPAATWEPAPTKTKTVPAYTPPAETTQPASGGSSPSGYAGVALDSHNVHRSNHSVSALQWDEGLANIAAQIARTCVYEHNTAMGGGGYGQNIAAGVDANGIDRVITNMFYNGEVNYYEGLYGQAQPDMSNFEKWGHFSQIVWKGTTHLGCATQHCTGGLGNTGSNVPPYFTVCNYKSPGNFANEYGDNVLRPLGNPTVYAD